MWAVISSAEGVALLHMASARRRISKLLGAVLAREGLLLRAEQMKMHQQEFDTNE
jgi:hypothetical protein